MTDGTRALIVVSSHRDWPEANRETGYWIGEVSHFVEALDEASIDYDVVSPQGGTPPMDPKSVSGMQSHDGGHKAFERNARLQEKLAQTLQPAEVDIGTYDAIYFAGGHGVMWDFPGNQELANLASRLYEAGGVVSAVCHGVGGLLDVKLGDGTNLVDGHEVTGFANIEERLMRLTSKVPYLTEDELKARGGKYKHGLPFLSHAVVDGRVVTGQNPGSTKRVAKEVVALLRGGDHRKR